jgi:autotransporter-associated beta strand protein
LINNPLTALSGLAVTGGTLGGDSTLTGSLNYTSSSSETLSVSILGAASTLTMNHAGSTLTLNSPSTYGGVTTVTAGTLQIGDGSTGSIPNTSSVSVSSGATFALDLAPNATFSTPVVDNGHFAITSAAASGTIISGVISGTGNFTQSTANRTTLKAANTYTGGTVISGGQLLIDNTTGSATGTGSVTLNNTAELIGTGNIAGKIILNSGSAIIPDVGGLLQAGGLTWNGGGNLFFSAGPSVSTELILSGPLTKGTAGTFNINVNDAGVGTTPVTETLITFTSTTFQLSDFHLDLIGLITGTLAFNSTHTALEIDNLVDPPPGPAQEPAVEPTPSPAPTQDLATESVPNPIETTAVAPGAGNAGVNLIATPEPGTAVLTLLGLAPLLARRRRGLKG